MRGLFIFPNSPLNPHFSGGSSRYLCFYKALLELGIEVHVLRLLEAGERSRRVKQSEESDLEQHESLKRLASSWTDVPFPERAGADGFRGKVELLWKAGLNPYQVAYPEAELLKGVVRIRTEAVEPDFIWAEWGLCGAVVAAMEPEVPWVYGHHDWAYRLSAVRRKQSGKKRSAGAVLGEWSMRRTEFWMSRNATAVVTGSKTEGEDLERIGCRNVHVLPLSYESVQAVNGNGRIEHFPQILHLGALSTTSNYIGLMAYVTKVQPRLAQLGKELFPGGKAPLTLIGEASRGKPEVLEKLRMAGATFAGHVKNLETVLKPFDIALIPYELDTGTRTKLPLLFNYAQVVVATKAGVAGAKEIRPGENCVVLEKLEDFADAICDLWRNPARRESIGRAAKRTFEENFTLKAQLPSFQKVIESLGAGDSGKRE